MSILTFPTTEDKEVIATAAMTWLQTRNVGYRTMIGNTLRFMLTRFGVDRIVAGDMVVTNKNGAIKITTKKTVSDRHCECGQYIYGDKVKILYINEKYRSHEVIYGCECGEVFIKQEEVGEC